MSTTSRAKHAAHAAAHTTPPTPTRPFRMPNEPPRRRVSFVVIALLLVIECVCVIATTQLIRPNVNFVGTEPYENGAFIKDYDQYNHLADALLEGSLALDLPVPTWLEEMDNPYDANLRMQKGLETGEPSYFDYAFYHGKYYSYFGVLPALTLYVPYKAITGTDLRTDVAVAILGCLFCLSLAFFTRRLTTRVFSGVSPGFYVMLNVFILAGCGVADHLFLPLFYSLPPIASLALVLAGLGFWLGARDGENMLASQLVLGAVCIGLTLAARPQAFLAVFLAIPLFWRDIRGKRFFARGGWGNTAAIIVPVLVIAGGVMVYNAARFGSPFQFGASYNLTGFDMTARGGIDAQLAGWSLFLYLFQPIDFSWTFPFTELIPNPEPLAMFPIEPYQGGFFPFAPAALAVFLLPFLRRNLRERGLWGTCLVSIAIAIPLMLLSAQMASISMRYHADFSLFLMIPAASVWLALRERFPQRAGLIGVLFGMLTVASVTLVVVGFFCNGRYGDLASTNPAVYDALCSLLA